MAYRNKTYICFDADVDMNYYKTLKMWKANENFDFDFYNAHELNRIMHFSSEVTIKRKLRERLVNTKVLIVLIGEKTKNLYKFVRWEIEQALNLDIPIIAVNLNKKNGIDLNRCPAILRDKVVMHIPYKKEAFIYAMNHWVNYYHKVKNDGKVNYYYPSLD